MPINPDLEPPVLLPGAEQIVTAFWELNTSRQIGMAMGPIPFDSIDAYAKRYGIDDLDEFHAFARSIRLMDGAFIEHQASQ